MLKRSYKVGLKDRLQDERYAFEYLNAAREDSEEAFALALRDVAEAKQEKAELAMPKATA